jgi:ribosomal protein S18 acetylase RimI-like enzyme
MPLPEMIRIPEGDYEQRRKLLSEGWREIEVLETYWGPAPEEHKHDGIDHIMWRGDSTLVEACCLAMRCFTHDRLHKDETVPKEHADMMKVITVAQHNRHIDEDLFVYGSPVSAFLLSHHGYSELHQQFGLVVELIAVDEPARGRGIAKKLVQHAAESYGKLKYIEAGTQMHNEPAKKLYESLGMSVVKRERTFHR